jgi:hypothetical protein
MTSAEQRIPPPPPLPPPPPPIVRTPLKPHRHPAWLLAVSALVIGAVVYSATLIPPYLGALVAVRRAHEAIAAGDRTAAETQLLDVLRLVPSSKSARIDIAVLLLADPSEKRQRRGLDYLAGIKLDKYAWQRVSAVLPDKFRGVFTTVKR